MQEFKLPEIGEGVVEGEIIRWLKQAGESVAANEALIEVMTDKATIEIPSPFSGRIVELLAAEGEIKAVGAVIARVEIGASASAPAPAAQAPAAAATTPVAAPAAAAQAQDRVGPSVPATPAARSLARSEGIDLRTIAVSERGRITKTEVIAAAQERAAAPSAPAVATSPVANPAAPVPASAAPAASAKAAAAPVVRGRETYPEDESVPFRGLRRVIADGLTRSYTTAVHYTYVEQIDVSKLVELRGVLKAAAAAEGVSLTYLPFIVKAVLKALKRSPIVNATLDEANQRIILRKRYHIGIAAATPNGLMVPVVRDADELGILDLSREILRVSEAAKAGTAKREELSGSTFTISSLGTIGGVLATPIINFPEVGIVGVHAMRKMPIVTDDDRIVVGHMMNLSVSLDHRVVDGYEGASFMQDIKKALEEPASLLLS